MYWNEIKTSGDLPPPRCDAVSNVVGTKLYIAGGWQGSVQMKDMWWLDMGTSTWVHEQIRNEGPDRINQQMSCFVEKELVVWSGHGDALYHNKIWLFDPRSCCWVKQQVKYQNPYNPSYITETAMSFDRAHGPVVFGGDDGCYSSKVQQLDLRNYSWLLGAARGDSPTPRHSHSSSYDSNGDYLYVTGGHDGRCCRDVSRLSLKNLRWEAVTAAGDTKPRVSPATYFANNRLYVFGGFCGDSYFSDTTLLDVKDPPVWRRPKVTDPPVGRASTSVAGIPPSCSDSSFISKLMLCFGGYDGTRYLNDLHILQAG